MAEQDTAAGGAAVDPQAVGIVERFVEFGAELRRHGLPVGSDDVLTFCRATAELTPSDQEDVFWAGRTTLVHRRDHLPIYDEVFRQFFLHLPGPRGGEEFKEKLRSQGLHGTLEVPDAEPGEEASDDKPLTLGLQAASVEIERDKRFSACTPEELQAVRRIINRMRLEPPLRRTRRRTPDQSGPMLDIRRMARESMQVRNNAPTLRRLHRKQKPRPLVLILDVSGSMADHSRNLLQFAYSMRRAARKVEVFCFGTRLTRITPALDRRNPDDAMRLAAARVLDWDGGTRIGWCLDDFVRRFGRRGVSRGATVIICSDGLDRGDPAQLAEAMERLQRLSHRIVWVNPLRGDDTAMPATLGMAVAGPFIDELESGHNLASLETFAARLPDIG
ncbi:MAG: VWA domain-containing protein [Actinomycetota bacterium]